MTKLELKRLRKAFTPEMPAVWLRTDGGGGGGRKRQNPKKPKLVKLLRIGPGGGLYVRVLDSVIVVKAVVGVRASPDVRIVKYQNVYVGEDVVALHVLAAMLGNDVGVNDLTAEWMATRLPGLRQSTYIL